MMMIDYTSGPTTLSRYFGLPINSKDVNDLEIKN